MLAFEQGPSREPSDCTTIPPKSLCPQHAVGNTVGSTFRLACVSMQILTYGTYIALQTSE